MKKVITLGVLCFCILTGNSQNKLSPEFLWKLGRLSEPVVSPDGKMILFGTAVTNLQENKSNRDLYLLPVPSQPSAPGTGLVRLTDFPGSESNARWRPDGKRIGFLSSKSGSSQLWEINPDGSDSKQVTDVKDGISNFSYSPDGKHISYTASVKLDQTVNEKYPDLPKANARIIDDLMYRHWDSWSDFTYSHVFILNYANGSVSGEPIDILKGEKFDSPVKPMGGGEQITWSPDGLSIVYCSKKLKGKEFAVSTNSDLYKYELASGKTQNLTEGMQGYDMDPVFSPDGKKLAWQSMERGGFESDQNRIFILDFATGKKENFSENSELSAENFRWSTDGKFLYFLSGIKATLQVFELNVSTKTIRQVTTGRHNLGSPELAGTRVIVTRQSMDFPNDLWMYDISSGKETQLTAINAELLSSVRMGQVEERWVPTTDGKQMLTWVIYPPDFDPNKKYPALLYCQGGPQSTVNQFFSTRWNFQLMAANGYIVIAPNRRGLPSFGKEWNDEISGDWGGQCMKDYLSAVDEVSKEKFINKEKIGAVGASFGGYSVYYLAGNHENRFKCFISHCGLFNLESWYTTTEEMFFANWDLKGSYWDSPRPVSYEKFSPHSFAKNWNTPILVIHGEKDFRVPLDQGMEAFGLAKMKGIPARFLYFPEEGHWVMGPQNSVLWQRVFFEWLDQWLK